MIIDESISKSFTSQAPYPFNFWPSGICPRPRSPRTLNGRLGGGGDKVPGNPETGRVGFLEALRHGQDDDLIWFDDGFQGFQHNYLWKKQYNWDNNIYIYILLEEKIDGTDCQHVVLNSQRNKAIWRECGIYFLIAVTRLLWSCLSTLMNVRMTDFLAWWGLWFVWPDGWTSFMIGS